MHSSRSSTAPSTSFIMSTAAVYLAPCTGSVLLQPRFESCLVPCSSSCQLSHPSKSLKYRLINNNKLPSWHLIHFGLCLSAVHQLRFGGSNKGLFPPPGTSWPRSARCCIRGHRVSPYAHRCCVLISHLIHSPNSQVGFPVKPHQLFMAVSSSSTWSAESNKVELVGLQRGAWDSW